MPDLYLQNCRVFSRFTTPLSEDDLKAVRIACSLRRADRFTTLAAAAVKAPAGQAFPATLPPSTGLITVSAFGPHKTVFATLDDILDYPEDMILPVRFSHSVHNAAAAYLGTILAITGPTFAVTGFEAPLFAALELAQTLLHAAACPKLLLIGVEERGSLTQAAPALAPERFPTEPEEIVCAMLLSTEATAGSRRVIHERHPGTGTGTGTSQPAAAACTLGLSEAAIRQLAESDNTADLRLSPEHAADL